MKKIIALFTVMLAFGFTASAQQKAVKPATTTTAVKPAPQVTDTKDRAVAESAAKDVAALGKVIAYTGTQQQDFTGLFEYKHRLLAQNLSRERKEILAQTIEAKIRATLNADQNAKLAGNTEMIKQLSN